MTAPYYAGALVVSVLLHLVVFWPTPEVKHKWVKAMPLSVHLSPGLLSKSALERDVNTDSLRRENSVVSRPGKTNRSGIIADVGRERPVAPIQQRRGPGALTAVENSTPTTKASELLEDMTLATGEEPPSWVSLARYRLAVAAAAVRLPRHSQAAMATGREGTVIVDVRLAAESVLPLVTVRRSSGFEELDREAVALLTRAVMSVPAWHTTAGEGVSIRLPVRFELQTH